MNKSVDEENIDMDLNNLIKNNINLMQNNHNNASSREGREASNSSLFLQKNAVSVQKLLAEQLAGRERVEGSGSEKSREPREPRERGESRESRSEKTRGNRYNTDSHSGKEREGRDLPVVDLGALPLILPVPLNNNNSSNSSSSKKNTPPNGTHRPLITLNPTLDISHHPSSSSHPSSSTTVNNNLTTDDSAQLADMNLVDRQQHINSQAALKKTQDLMKTRDIKLKIQNAQNVLNNSFESHIVGAVPGGKLLFGTGKVSISKIPRRNSLNAFMGRDGERAVGGTGG